MLQFTLRLKQQRKQGQVPRCGQDKKHTSGSSINYGQETEIKKKKNRHLHKKIFLKKLKMLNVFDRQVRHHSGNDLDDRKRSAFLT